MRVPQRCLNILIYLKYKGEKEFDQERRQWRKKALGVTEGFN